MNSNTVQFRHEDEGISEAVWWSTPQWEDVPILDLVATASRFSTVLVAAAHPDDETIGVGGLLADLAALELPITVLMGTNGERSQPGLEESGRSRLGDQRRHEVQRAVEKLASHAHLSHLNLPDARLSEHEEELMQAIVNRSDEATLILAPWTDDGHTDHDSLGRAAQRAAKITGAVVVHFPIWMWHWSEPASVPWSRMVAAEPSRVACWLKRAALEEFASQRMPSNVNFDHPPVAAILSGTLLARARRLIETLIDPGAELPVLSREDRDSRTITRSATFDEMYDAGSDPWGNAQSFYEQRRRSLLLAALGRARYERILELGCADGHVTSALVNRAEEVVAIDTSPRAVAAARLAAPAADITAGNLPNDIPHEQFDLVILSEVGYFLTATELIATLRRARAALVTGGELLLCHWQHPTKSVPLDGILVHEQARTVLGYSPSAQYRDGDLCIEVWADAPSIAESEGRT
ncbi:bifunctional PIG-L family deacetylase/class I SAM-dependent methyltransferase [Ornithinimicrobium sp. INDO-MA30-4]|uniref:bifunctional PIG-L family deacetylase/class I SAM-dependent methyltransferase n=1 Tax=Ornithinimicrobium sp. INDO-MA30-4 TaxID=2908651 RepID=UPI001F27F80A|nr:bifunctional PIG-L family deacetylase/class I SAM-dependent methyltransferase [Ornithinimicrobium sp. INDO-MA30-4]UJH70139.1 bifunctional PIG-L family deacetylase/class I SAM-dependent methyltransferase [Ornithinimicrobium sp. INDO-MA30-4]